MVAVPTKRPWRRTILSALLIALVAFLFERKDLIALTWNNRPGKLKEVNEWKGNEVVLRDQVRNCEDVLLVEDIGVAVLSCDPGRDGWNTVMGTFHNSTPNGGLYIYDYSHPNLPENKTLKPITLTNFAANRSFHPLGIALDAETDILYAVNHASGGSVIETFELNIHAARAHHLGTTSHPLLHTPNSIHSLGEGKLLVTNNHYFAARRSSFLATAETWLGLPGGSVVYIDTHDAENSATMLARVPFANGITMVNEMMIAVASTSKPGVYFYNFTFTPTPSSSSSPSSTTPSLTFHSLLPVPGMIDNLSVDSAGKLLMAGHPHGPSLLRVAKGRGKRNCNQTSELEEERRACECDAPSWIAEWSEKDGLRVLFQGSGSGGYGSSSTAVRDVEKGVGLVVGLYERGVMRVW